MNSIGKYFNVKHLGAEFLESEVHVNELANKLLCIPLPQEEKHADTDMKKEIVLERDGKLIICRHFG